MNPLLQGHSGSTPETSRNVFSINEGTNEDDFQSDPHPEAGLLTSGREDGTGVQRERERESTQAHDNVTKISTNPLCYYAVSVWTNTERLRSHLIHSCSNEEWTGKKLSSKSEISRCNSFPQHVNSFFYEYFSLFYLILVHFSKLSSYRKPF